jgi:hypothetical protein
VRVQDSPIDHIYSWTERRPVLALITVILVWALLRAVFFDGCWWAWDDWFHVRYAYLWDGPPKNIYEARLLFNALLRASMALLGFRPIAWALPGLLASLMTVLSAYWLGLRQLGRPGAFVAGVVAACMPIDILFCSVPLAGPVSAGFAACALALLLGSESGPGLAMAIAAACLSALCHPAGVFAVLAMAAAAFFFFSRKRALVFVAVAIPLFLALDMGASALASGGDPFHNYALLRNWRDPDGYVLMYSAAWFTRPFTSLVFSKAFGLTIPIVVAGLFVAQLRRSRVYLGLLAYCFFLWLWFSFGTAKPTTYEPFWRDTRFWQPMTPALALMAAWIAQKKPSVRGPLLLGVCGLGIILVASSGVWGQSAGISRDMWQYAGRNPNALFLADSQTIMQMEAYNRFQTMSNVCALPCSTASSSRQPVFLLFNPLNQPEQAPNRPKPVQLGIGNLRCGAPVLVTALKPREIAAFLPLAVLQRHPFLIRRPPGAIRPVLFAPDASEKTMACDAAPD